MDVRFDVHHFFHFPADESLAGLLQSLEERIVSKLSDKIAEVGTSAEEAIARLEQQVASGGSSQADMDALDAIKAKLDASGRAEPSPPSGPTEPAGPTDPPVGEPVTEPVVDTSGSGEAVITPSVPPAA